MLDHLLRQWINYQVPFLQIKCVCKANPAVACKKEDVARLIVYVHFKS